MAIIFDGYALAAQKEAILKQRVSDLKERGVNLCIASVLFTEDQGSVLYTQLKKEAANRIGIEYRVTKFSLRDDVGEVIRHIDQLNSDPTVTGIIIQKPWRKTWQDVTSGNATDFQTWWLLLTQEIDPRKDVDGLHPDTIAAIRNNTWQQHGKVLPATCEAVISILESAPVPASAKYVILGKSDLLGQPLFYYLQNKGLAVEMIGSTELQDRLKQGMALKNVDVVISATGRHHLIKGEMLTDNAIVIDVGEPQPDVEIESVAKKAAFVTPVPGGVGPMTVMSLMENCLKLVN